MSDAWKKIVDERPELIGLKPWQPIETAPRHCPVLLWAYNGAPPEFRGRAVVAGQWDDVLRRWVPTHYVPGAYDAEVDEPTHWRPMPRAPYNPIDTPADLD